MTMLRELAFSPDRAALIVTRPERMRAYADRVA